MVKEGYKDAFLAKFDTALANDFGETATAEAAESVTTVDMQTLRETALALANAQEELEAATADKTTLASEKATLEANVATLQTQVQTLTKEPEDDKGAGSQQPATTMQGTMEH